jgi:hypothetical protein
MMLEQRAGEMPVKRSDFWLRGRLPQLALQPSQNLLRRYIGTALMQRVSLAGECVRSGDFVGSGRQSRLLHLHAALDVLFGGA